MITETVSLEDTAISLHTLKLQLLWGVLSLGSQNSKCQVLANFSFWGRGILDYFILGEGYSWVVKIQSAKYCQFFISEGGGGDYSRIG